MISLLLTAAAVAATPTVAITDLDNHTGNADFDDAGPGVAALLVSRLVQTDSVTVVERNKLSAILAEQQLSASGLVDPATAIRAGKLIGAQYLVTGDLFSVQLPSVSVAVRVIDTTTGEVVLSRDLTGDVGTRGEAFFRLIDELATELMGALDLELDDVDRARWQANELRELESILAYGRQLSRAPMSHPYALVRDDRLDHLGPDATWEVWDQQGTSVAMPAFARRVGDRSTAERWESQMVDVHSRARRKQNLGIGLLAGGAVLAASSAFAPSDGAPLLYLGASAGFVAGGIVMATAPGTARTRIASLKRPSGFYAPSEADEWIQKHNEELE